MWTNHLKRLSVLTVTILLSLALVELSLRVLSHIRQNYDVEMWRYANDLKIPVDDERSHIHAQSKNAHIMGKEVQLNSHGLRDREFSYEKPNNTFRIISIGDSYTFGFGADQDKTFSKLIEKKLNEQHPEKKYEVLNMGVGNYNAIQELAALKIQGLKYHPDHILWNFYINDAEETQKLKPSFLSTSLISMVYLKSFLYKMKASLISKSNYVDFYKKTFQGESGKHFFEAMDQLVDLSQKAKVPVTVVLLPDFRKLHNYPFAEEHALVVNYFKSKGINVIDTVEAFDPLQEKKYWVAHDDPHPNNEAHEIIAQKIFQGFKR